MKKKIRLITIALFMLGYQMASLAQDWQYVVKKGDSLWTIAEEYLIHDSYVKRLQLHNNVVDPLVLQPGQVIHAPVEWLGNLPSAARIISASGQVEVIRNNAKIAATSGYLIEPDDQLITAEDSSAYVEFADQSVLNIYSNSSLLFKSLKQSHDGSVINVKVEIDKGRVDVRVNPNKKPGHQLEIKSPSAVTAVRGTEFRIGVQEGSTDTITEVIEGIVSVSAENKQIYVKQDFGTKTSLGQAPIKPVKLLSAPNISSPGLIETKVSGFNWDKIEEAQYYRVRVSHDKGFSDVIFDKLVSEPQVNSIFFPEDGEFFASVRAADINQIEGHDSIVSLNVNARPEPPYINIMSPKENSKLFDSRPKFTWSLLSGSVDKIRYQLATSNDFESPLEDLTIESSDGIKLNKDLENGDYYWRVANIDADGQGPFSDIFRFSVALKPELNSEVLDSEKGSSVSLRFSKDPDISKYHVQVARDSDFSKMIFNEWIEGEEFAFNTKGAGSYYIRLGIEDHEGVINYADSQKVIVPFSDWKQVFISLITGLIIAL